MQICNKQKTTRRPYFKEYISFYEWKEYTTGLARFLAFSNFRKGAKIREISRIFCLVNTVTLYRLLRSNDRIFPSEGRKTKIAGRNKILTKKGNAMHSLGLYQKDLHDCNIDRIALLVKNRKKKRKLRNHLGMQVSFRPRRAAAILNERTLPIRTDNAHQLQTRCNRLGRVIKRMQKGRGVKCKSEKFPWLKGVEGRSSGRTQVPIRKTIPREGGSRERRLKGNFISCYDLEGT